VVRVLDLKDWLGPVQFVRIVDILILCYSLHIVHAVVLFYPSFFDTCSYCHDYNCNSTTIQLQLWLSHAPASIWSKQKINMPIFCRSCVVVVSQSNRTQIVISITSVVVECVMVSSYRSHVIVESQLWYKLKCHFCFRYYISILCGACWLFCVRWQRHSSTGFTDIHVIQCSRTYWDKWLKYMAF